VAWRVEPAAEGAGGASLTRTRTTDYLPRRGYGHSPAANVGRLCRHPYDLGSTRLRRTIGMTPYWRDLATQTRVFTRPGVPREHVAVPRMPTDADPTLQWSSCGFMANEHGLVGVVGTVCPDKITHVGPAKHDGVS
jgi:hypothetical protein